MDSPWFQTHRSLGASHVARATDFTIPYLDNLEEPTAPLSHSELFPSVLHSNRGLSLLSTALPYTLPFESPSLCQISVMFCCAQTSVWAFSVLVSTAPGKVLLTLAPTHSTSLLQTTRCQGCGAGPGKKQLYLALSFKVIILCNAPFLSLTKAPGSQLSQAHLMLLLCVGTWRRVGGRTWWSCGSSTGWLGSVEYLWFLHDLCPTS